MSSFAWIVLGLLAVLMCNGAGQGGGMDIVLGSALLLVIYGAVSRGGTPE